MGWWAFETSGTGRFQRGGDVNLQSDPTAANRDFSTIGWKHFAEVDRDNAGGGSFRARALLSGASQFNYDDWYCVALDDVSMTVTPANLANSAENGGLRVDGRDLCSQPIPAGILTDTGGWIKFRYIPRHDESVVDAFGNPASYILRVHFDANHFIDLWHSLANRVDLAFNDGGGVHAANWAPATLTTGIEYLFEIKYNAGEMILKIDGVTRITITVPINFANIPTIIYWGTDQTTALQVDAVFKAP